MATMKKAQGGAKMVKATKIKQNLKDATQNKNMRPTAPNTGNVKTTMGNGKTIAKSGAAMKKQAAIAISMKKAGMHKMPGGAMMKDSAMKAGGKMKTCKGGC